MQSILLLSAASALLQQPAVRGPVVEPSMPVAMAALAPFDSTQGGRPRAFEYSRAYETRLAIHHWASYATIPLFAAEYLLGQKLFTDTTAQRRQSTTRDAHRVVALGVAGLFGVNTITGMWNLWEGRKDPNGRARRFIHAGLMLAADAGFVATGASAPGGRAQLAGTLEAERSRHRTIAIASMATSLASYLMMLVWK